MLSSNSSRLHRTNAATQWLPPVGLIVLSLIPVLAGAVRLNELMGGPEITANNARFVASPIPVTVHIVSVTVYSLLGALQFVPSLRRGRPSWHRIAGRILVPAGVLAVAEYVIRRRPGRAAVLSGSTALCHLPEARLRLRAEPPGHPGVQPVVVGGALVRQRVLLDRPGEGADQRLNPLAPAEPA